MNDKFRKIATMTLSAISFLGVLVVADVPSASAATVCQVSGPCTVTLEIVEARKNTRTGMQSKAYDVYGGGSYKCVKRTGAIPNEDWNPVTTYTNIRQGKGFVAGQLSDDCSSVTDNTHICEFTVPNSPNLAAVRVILYSDSCRALQIFH